MAEYVYVIVQQIAQPMFKEMLLADRIDESENRNRSYHGALASDWEHQTGYIYCKVYHAVCTGTIIDSDKSIHITIDMDLSRKTFTQKRFLRLCEDIYYLQSGKWGR